MYESIKVAQFGVGSEKELELLASMDCPKDLLIVVLTHDTDRLYIVSHKGCEELDGPTRTLIEGGMFPNITGNITPRFKLMRVDVPTILASSAKIAEEMGIPTTKKEEVKEKVLVAPTVSEEKVEEPKSEKKSSLRKKSSTSTTKKTSTKKATEKKEPTKKTTTKSTSTKTNKKEPAKKTTTKKSTKKSAE